MEKKTVHELLSELQRTVKVPKTQRNSFGNYNYRSCEDILEAVKPLLPVGATIIINDEVVQIGTRYYIKARATLTLGDVGVFVEAYAREEEIKKGMDGAQITGSASSYARKYALNGLLLIDDTKDADTQDNTEKKEVKTVAKPVAPKVPVSAKQKIVTLLKKLNYNTETKESSQNAVIALTQLELVEANFDEIVSRLEVLVNEQK